jgi:hypothetical protein
MDDDFIEDQNVLDQLQMDFLEKHHHDNMQIMASMLARVCLYSMHVFFFNVNNTQHDLCIISK